MDPHCGWCYGNGYNISQLQKSFSNAFEFEILVGGMWLGTNAPFGGPQLASYIETHAPRMSKTTGVEVSQKYYDRTADTSYQFSSLEPCAAIYLIKQMVPEKAFVFAKKVQESLFVRGLPLDTFPAYSTILKELAIDFETFQSQWMTPQNIQETQKEFEKARLLAKGFPTLIYTKDSKDYLLASGYFQLDRMVQQLLSIQNYELEK